MKHSIPRLAALLMALALGAAACGSSATTDAAAPAVDAEGGDATRSSLLDISAEAADGTTVNLSNYAGQDLMLWFWAPW